MAVRTICLRVIEVIEGGTKTEFYGSLRETLELSRNVANRVMTECVRQDTDPFGKIGKIYTYPVVKDMSAGASHMIANIARNVEKKYKQERWHIARGRKSSPSFRSYPWPLLCNKSSNMLQLSWSGEVLTARIKLLSGWWTLRLKAGSNYRDQIKGVVDGMSRKAIGDSKIWVDRKHVATLGISVRQEEHGGDAKRSGVLHVATSRDNLITCVKSRSDVPFVISGDDYLRRKAESSRRYQRLRQDRKKDGPLRHRARNEMNQLADRENRFSQTYIHELSMQIVKYAIRRKVAQIEFDATIKSFAKFFPWFQLTNYLAYKCEDAGIVFREVTQAVVEPDLSKPHVYWRYSPATGKVKIGQTTNGKQRAKSAQTDNPDADSVVLAIENVAKAKLFAKEKHWHAYFAAHRLHGEWFAGEPVITWLRAAGWLGNAGNLSQIVQVLDVEQDTFSAGHLQAHGERLNQRMPGQPLAQCGVNVGDHVTCDTAPEVDETCFGD